MKTYLDNLRPFEKRLVVGVGVMLFVVFNAWFVVPHFSDWQRVSTRREMALRKLQQYNDEIAQSTTLKAQMTRLMGGGAYVVPAEEQSIHFANEVLTKAALCGITFSSASRVTESTNNPFFLQKSQTIGLTAREEQVVNFLFNLGASNSMVRVRDLTLRPDAPHQALMVSVKVIADYQKAQKPAAPGPKPAAPGSNRATASIR